MEEFLNWLKEHRKTCAQCERSLAEADETLCEVAFEKLQEAARRAKQS